ncbi:hypothetical protein [Stenotrophomonas sp. SAU14A_NAIMI4_5]|uniref:hypothetical protein n=1 Tax=Stenotrophomonas sp. SAU14A_NAIMI4_5 TaxID=2072413 RepID=UPI00131EE7EE|nr:hypothetical protein [Stenotrophomonas sp. SAU14A_NAIMI4_5]
MKKKRVRNSGVVARSTGGANQVSERKSSIAPLLLSSFALLVSLAGVFLQWRADVAQRREVVNLWVKPRSESQFIRLSDFGAGGGLLETEGALTVANNGGIAVAITGFDIKTLPSDSVDSSDLGNDLRDLGNVAASKSVGKAYGFFVGLNGGLRGKDGSVVALPIVLAPGEAKVFFVRVGLMVSRPVYDKLVAIDRRVPRERDRILNALYDEGLDSHGNPVKVGQLGGSGRFIEFAAHDDPRMPLYSFDISTARGGEFSVRRFWTPDGF